MATTTLAGRRRLTGALVLFGLVLTSAGALMFGIRTTVVDASTTVDAATAALRDPAVRTLLADRTTDAVLSQLVGDDTVRNLTAYGVDARRDLAPIAASLVDTPEFTAAYATAVRGLHDRVFSDTSITPSVEVGSLVAVVRAKAIAVNPAYVQVLRNDVDLTVPLPVDALPDLTVLDRTLTSMRATVLLATGLAFLALAIAFADERWRPVRRIAVWLLAWGGAQLALCLAAYLALDRASGDAAPIVRAAGDAVLGAVVRPALVPVAVGAIALLVSMQMRRSPADARAGEGRAAFLTEEWRFDATFEPETLRTAPSTATYGR